MPKLLAFFPCDKVVIDQLQNNVSVSAIIEEVVAGIPEKLMPPPNGAVVPNNWTVFAMWHRDTSENTVPFEVMARFFSPNEKLLVQTSPPTRANFDNNTKTSQRVVLNLNGFPIGAPGICQIALMMKADGETDFSEVARFPVIVKHEIIAESDNRTASDD